MPGKGTEWSPERLARLIELRRQGIPYAILAERFGVSSDAARLQYSKATKKPPVLTQGRDYLAERIEAHVASRARECGVRPDLYKRAALRWTVTERFIPRRFAA